MKTKDKKFVTTQKMLTWQYKQLIGELQELQRHASDVTCPCRLSEDLGENCLCKHSLGLFILAGETAAMDSANTVMLDDLAFEANEKHEKMKGFLCQKNDEPEFIEWSRQWRKKLEKLYYYDTCKVKLKEEPNPDIAALFESHKVTGYQTAISRKAAPAPLRQLYDRGFLNGRMLDYGSGRGCWYGMECYDPYYKPDMPAGQFDTITCIYVLNVVTEEEQNKIIKDIKSKLKPNGTAFFAVRRDIPKSGQLGRGTQQRWVALHPPEFKVFHSGGLYAIYYMGAEPSKAAELAENSKLIRVAGTYKNGAYNLKVSHTDKTEAVTNSVDSLPKTIEEVLSRISEHKSEVSNKTFAFGTTGLIKYEFVYRIVDGLKLIASNDPFTFEPNPKYPRELQPRIRARAAAELQVKNIAANLIPDILLVDFRSTDRGAPIIGDDMVVESGNGRIMALLLSSRDAPAKFAEYVAALKQIAPAYALDPEEASKFDVPILVRQRLTPVNRKDFAQDCNAPVALEQSAIEKARTDAEKMTVTMLQSIRVDEGQSVEDAIRSPDNKPFVVSFLNKLPQNEQAKLLDAQGLLNSDGLRRIILAIFVATFIGDVGLKLAETFFESTDPNVKATLNGITGSLGILAQGEGLILSGARYADYSIGGDLSKAVTKFSSIKKTPGQTVSKYLAQIQMMERELTPFQERILTVLDEHSRSGKRIAGILSLYAQKVIDSAPPGQASFMAGERYTKEELFENAVKSVVEGYEEEREEARRKEEAKRRQPVAAMSEIAKLFEVARLRQQLRFMIDDTAPAPSPVYPTAPAVSPITAGACPPTCTVITPSGKKLELFDFQKEGVAWLKGRSYALLADDMGLGKTPQAIWWGAERRPVLVVVPSALVLNWAREISEMWRPGDTVKVLDGKEPFPASLPDWCVMSYGMLDRYLPALQQAGFESIIIDEAHNVKNLDAQRTKNILELVAPKEDPEHPLTYKLIPNRLAVTGTPILNRPIELFALMVFLGVKRRSEYKDYLTTYTEHKVIKGRTVFTGAKNLSQLHNLIQPFTLRRLKKDVLKSLPPKTITPLFVPISNVAEYREAERNFLTWIREKKGDVAAIKAASAELIVKMNSLRQLAAEGKVLPVADWLKPCSDGQGKVIIFSSFKEPLDKLADLKGASVVYTGSMNKEDRQQAVDDFQETQKYCYFMGTVGAAGVGITLTAANRVCFLDLPWTPGGKIQAEDRAHRIGQTKPVEIVNVLAKGTIDERMLQLLADKEFIISQAVDGKTKDEAINDSISGSLLDSYRMNPNLNETCRQYTGELQEPPVDAVDADTLEILQGLNEEAPAPAYLVELFEKKSQFTCPFEELEPIVDPKDRIINRTFRFRNAALNKWVDITADSPAAAIEFLGWDDADVDIRKMWKSSGKINEGGQVMEGWGNITPVQGKKTADSSKLRSMADAMQTQIDEKRNPAIAQQNITARRARIAGSMAADADYIEQTQSALRGMADAIDAGTLPEVLSKVTNRAQVERILHFKHFQRPEFHRSNLTDILEAAPANVLPVINRIAERQPKDKEYYQVELLNDEEVKAVEAVIDASKTKLDKYGHSRNLNYLKSGIDEGKRLLAAGIDSQEKYDQAKAALKAFVSGPSPEVIAENKKRELVASLIGVKIPGFFPTPRPVIDRMIELADLRPGMSVLEPSAGKGDIADAVKEACPDCVLTLVEYYNQLCEILKSKGYEPVCGDFLETWGNTYRQTTERIYTDPNAPEYDRVLMNPPFENHQDVKHLWHAYELLKPGGRVVAIIGEHCFFGEEEKCSDFRAWLEKNNATIEKLESGAFTGKEAFRQTGVASRIVVIDKPALSKPKENMPQNMPDLNISEPVSVEAIYTGAPVKGRLFELAQLFDMTPTEFMLKRLYPCNLTAEEIEKVLSWRPLRDFIAWAVGTTKAVQFCSIGMVPGVYQITVKDVHEINDIEAEVVKRAKAIPTARKVYSPVDAVFEIVVPDESRETELAFAPQEISTGSAHREPAAQAAMFEAPITYKPHTPETTIIHDVSSFVPPEYSQYIVDLELRRSKKWNVLTAPNFKSPEDVQRICRLLRKADREILMVFCLDTRNRLIGIFQQAIGDQNSAVASPLETARIVFQTGAVAVILAHNHPSGDPDPSADDRALLSGLKMAFEPFKVAILDMIVIGHTRDYSIEGESSLSAPTKEEAAMLEEIKVCSPGQKGKRERLILTLKKKNTDAGCKVPEGNGSKTCPNVFAVATKVIKCRLGSSKLTESGDTIKISGKCEDGQPEKCVFSLRRVGNTLRLTGTSGISKAVGSSALREKVKDFVKVKGIKLTNDEYEAFVNYLNAMEPESFTKGDLEQFLEEFDSNEEFRKAYKPQLKEEPVSARVKAALENPIEVKA